MKLLEQLLDEKLLLCTKLEQTTADVLEEIAQWNEQMPADQIEAMIALRGDMMEQIVRVDNRIRNVSHNGETYSPAAEKTKQTITACLGRIAKLDQQCRLNLERRLEEMAGKMQHNSLAIKTMMAYAGDDEYLYEENTRIDLRK